MSARTVWLLILTAVSIAVVLLARPDMSPGAQTWLWIALVFVGALLALSLQPEHHEA